ncbi:hypothetical protein GUITHDRAFT_166304 [Guillardia theta CCMP2712]|uniref:Extrinsic protein in photosystem II n=3 Tax=Guillardia theta TaxID=55529 RepID=L1IE04_GUITC|nr:hypothetical protein GUITHDRAFT_166304 [Guillardia theta CCMP2712]EKX34060.1 hypothetical protein GUITHDRAFT_166304 [Guillardia theta CCMP2712]|eukprot:XP_005821040.1 hypothetical protein GUITHDRAFT_166304 [Guillardia theta CCMP2712]
MFTRVSIVAALAASASAFSPAPVVTGKGLRTRSCDVTMQMDRRAMVKGVAAAVVAAPAAAFASIGDSPKQSYFGAGAMSAPFGDVYGLTGPGIWSKMNDTERGIYERILGDSKKRLQSVEDYINNNEWDRSRTALRLGMYETRKAMIRINEASGSQEAKDLFAKFKRQLEATDFALAKKDGALAFKLRAATEVTFSQWLASVGL